MHGVALVCAPRADAQDFAREAGEHYRERQMQKTIGRSIALAVAALWSLPTAAGDLRPPTVYVAPGGVYIGSAQVYTGPGVANGQGAYVVPGPAYVPGYGPSVPAPAYVPNGYGPNGYGPNGYGPNGYGPDYAVPSPTYAPGYGPGYEPPPLSVYGSRYGARPAARPRVYASPYPAEYAPRPPVAVPYNGGRRCVAAYGRVICD
jgi:hypothetical protein